MKRDELRLFDPTADWDVVLRSMPHWSQPGVVTFVTWRLADSLPPSALRRIDREIDALLTREGLDPRLDHRKQLEQLPPRRRAAVHFKIFSIRDRYLDQGCGACYLASRELAEVVIDSLQHFDGDRYALTDAVVMPNHVHFLCAFASDNDMLKQCTDLKRFIARDINRQLGRKGELWQVDQFDHLVRSPEQFECLQRYVAENPVKAGLEPGTFLLYPS